MVDPDFPSERRVGGDSWSVAGIAAVASLLFNLLLGGWLWHNQAAQDARLDQLEFLAGTGRTPAGETVKKKTASQGDRTAFLLASAGNADGSKRVLEAIPVEECADIARVLIARPAASDRNAALGAVFLRIAANDPARAVALLDGVQEPALRNTLAVRVGNAWIDQNPDAAARWLVAQGRPLFSEESFDAELARATARWSAYDPEAATRLLAAQSPLTETILAALGAASLEWGRKNPQAALRWAQTLPAVDPRRLSTVQGAFAGWAEREPAPAAAALQGQFYDGGDGGELYVALAGDIADHWAKSNLNAAAQWAAGLPSRRARREALRRVAVDWAGTDLPAAARWAGALTASGARAEAWKAVVTAWPGDDLDGEGVWVSSLAVGPDRDESVAFHAGKLALTDPAKALTWVQTIAEAQFRSQNVQEILARWGRRDVAAARNWAVANGVEFAPSAR